MDVIRIVEDENEGDEDDLGVSGSEVGIMEQNVRKSKRNRKLSTHLQDYDLNSDTELMAALSAGSLPHELPRNYNEALNMENG